jgi:hypothetical protein
MRTAKALNSDQGLWGCGHDASTVLGGRALPISLSPIIAYSDGDGASLAPNTNAGLVNIDHY